MRRGKRENLIAATALLLSVVGLLLLGGCVGGDIHLKGKAGDLFRKITGASGMTLNDKVAIYGKEAPDGSTLKCHEDQHKAQAAVVCEANVKLGFIDDDDLSCTIQWVATYSNDYIQYGYENRWEKSARERCGQEVER